MLKSSTNNETWHTCTRFPVTSNTHILIYQIIIQSTNNKNVAKQNANNCKKKTIICGRHKVACIQPIVKVLKINLFFFSDVIISVAYVHVCLNIIDQVSFLYLHCMLMLIIPLDVGDISVCVLDYKSLSASPEMVHILSISLLFIYLPLYFFFSFLFILPAKPSNIIIGIVNFFLCVLKYSLTAEAQGKNKIY